jgi:hypothetical protein
MVFTMDRDMGMPFKILGGSDLDIDDYETFGIFGVNYGPKDIIVALSQVI